MNSAERTEIVTNENLCSLESKLRFIPSDISTSGRILATKNRRHESTGLDVMQESVR